MKKLIPIFTLLIFLSGCSEKVYIPQPPQPIRNMVNGCYVKLGCCSYHGGVCGENYDSKAICCDGTLSKSCKCENDSYAME